MQAQSGVLPNPAIQGFAVRVSGFLTHLCIGLLIACSTKTQHHFYFPLLAQVALTVITVLLCRGSNQLNHSDIEFAIIQTRSPVSVYVLLLVIPRLFFQRSSFKKDPAPSMSNNDLSLFCGLLKSDSLDWALIHRRAWGVLYAFCCLSLNLVRQFDKAGYSGSIQTTGGHSITPPNKGWLGLALCSVSVYECVLYRHNGLRLEIMHQLAGTRKKSLKAWPLSKRVRWGFVATWFIATKLHPWLPFVYALVMFLNWSIDMNIWSIEDDFQWTYGQLVAICQITIILYPCWQLCYSRWREVPLLLRRLIFDMIWLISGKCRRPWANPTESDLMLKDLWNAFPPDVTPEEIVLPTAIPAPPVDVAYSFLTDDRSVRIISRRRRQNRPNREPRSEHVTGSLLEEDIADQLPGSAWSTICEVR